MENSAEAEAVDDQGSGWFEVKKRHRSSAKFSVQSWSGGFSGKNGSGYQPTQSSVTDKGGILRGKSRCQLPKRRANLSIHGRSNMAISSSELNKNDNGVCPPDKSVVKQDSEDSRCMKSSQLFVTDNARVEETQKISVKNKPDVVPKIKWGDLEDDILPVRHENNSQADIKFGDTGGNNLVSGVYSSTNVQEKKLAVSLSNSEDIAEENCKEFSEVTSQDVEVAKVNDGVNAQADALKFHEDHDKILSAKNEDHPSTTYSSGREAGIVLNLQVPAAVSEGHGSKISELPVTVKDLGLILQESESLVTDKVGPEISGEAAIVAKTGMPVVAAENEAKMVELPATDEKLCMEMSAMDSDLILPKKSAPEISTEGGSVVKIQWPVISEVKELPISEVCNPKGTLCTEVIAQDSESLASGKHGPEMPGGSMVSASVEDGGCVPNGTMQDELLKVHNVSLMGEGDAGDAGESKERFRERLWCFLFENLNRAVDELYLLCELECDEEQMKEAILVLEEAASDFKELSTRVKEFENVKRSPSQLTDGSPITLRSDHRRPHALSWEVRRMTTSPHRAEILSSSLEAFKKIQQERANVLATDNAKSQQFDCSRHFHASGDVIKKSGGKSDITPNARDLVMKSRKPGVSSDLARGNLNCDKRNLEMGRSNKVNFVQNGLEPSNANSSRITRTDGSTFSGAGKSKREFEAEKPLHKKDQVLTESTIEKNLKSTDHLKKQVPLSEKDKHRRNSNSWRSMDAWKEKRNWEDILSSPFRVSSRISHSPGVSRKSAERARILHDKLMSPEKKKKTALDLKKEAEEKHTRAMRIRSELENERVQKLQRTSEKLNRVNEWQAVRTMKLREGMYARHQRSESRHEAFLAQVVRRAGDESTKVNEVRFITSLNEENKKLMLRQKLHDSELRRAEKIQMIKTKQKEDMAREEAVLERRKHIEAEKLQRLAETQRKKEEAQVRREEERKASSAAREARAIEQLRRREERAKAQQEEAELLAQKLAERLSESEQRRKFYLEQIRERASTDFRDQSSPLLRRSMNKEGQGRSTPTNNGDNFQENGIAGTESSNLASANVTLQHSLKRRIKKIRQRLMALKYEFPEPPVGSENTSIGYRTAVGTARAKIGRWLQELQRIRQERKGASSIGLITAEMIKFLEGKDAELQASRQAGLLDFIASALPASHTSKPEACQVTVHLLKLLRVVLSASANRSYFLAQNLLPPIIPMLSAAIENYIKIAASLNVPGSNNLPSTKTSVESFESISEVLDNFLWTVGKVIGQSSSDERELQLRDGLLELLIAYQVIHRLRDLFALYDRPQVEGSPFPSSILLSIQLLVVLTCIPRTHSSINWEASPIETVLLNERKEAKPAESSNAGSSFTTATSEDCRLQLSVINGSAVVSAPNTFEDRLLIESCNVNRSDESVSIGEGGEKKPTYISVEFDNVNTNTTGVQDKSQKILIANKDEKNSLFVDAEQKNNSVLNAKEPVAFLLSVISETGLVSLPSLLTAVLLQANNRLSSEQGLYVLPSNFEEVATGVLKVFNNLALLDITFMQRMLARPDLKMEFFHLMGFVLSHCTNKWKVASDQVGLLLLESLLLLGYFALMHPGNQAVLRWGKSPTILHKVCDLPFVFFSDPELMPVLAGTIVATCYGCEQNKGVVLQELSMDMLLSLLRSCRNVHPAVRSTVTGENLLTEDFVESHQQVAELKKCQGDTPLRSNRYNSKTSRVSLAKVSAIGNNIRGGKMRSQKESRAAKYSEEVTLKHNSLAPETSLMLHCRFPSSFIDKAERFFSVGITNVGDEI